MPKRALFRSASLLVLAALPLAGCGSLQQASLSEKECMARVMYFESNRSSPDGMLAVGTVVMNRLDSPRYPKTVCGVVGQDRQFAPGALTRSVDSRGYTLAEKVADDVLDGNRHEGVGSAMFFHTAGYSFPYRNMRYVTLAGGNIFYEKRYPAPGEPAWPSSTRFAKAFQGGAAKPVMVAEAKVPETQEVRRKPVVLASLEKPASALPPVDDAEPEIVAAQAEPEIEEDPDVTSSPGRRSPRIGSAGRSLGPAPARLSPSPGPIRLAAALEARSAGGQADKAGAPRPAAPGAKPVTVAGLNPAASAGRAVPGKPAAAAAPGKAAEKPGQGAQTPRREGTGRVALATSGSKAGDRQKVADRQVGGLPAGAAGKALTPPPGGRIVAETGGKAARPAVAPPAKGSAVILALAERKAAPPKRPRSLRPADDD